MIKLAGDNSKGANKEQLTFKPLAKTSKIPATKNSIDAIYEVMVIQHIPTSKLDAIFAEFARVLKQGGMLGQGYI